MENKYYFYNGFDEPKEVDINDLIIEDNYLGEVDFLEEHESCVKDSDEDYNEIMSIYNLFRNPKLSDFVLENSRYFDKSDLLVNLENWAQDNSVLDSFEITDLIARKFNEIDDFDWEEGVVDVPYYAEKLGYEHLEYIDVWVKNNQK